MTYRDRNQFHEWKGWEGVAAAVLTLIVLGYFLYYMWNSAP